MNLTINNISKTFKQKNNSIDVLNNISYEFKENKLYFITGESGEGKSTLLSILGLLDEPTSGEILFDGKSVPSKERNKFISDHISFVFQDYNLFEELTIYENLSLFVDDKNKIKELLESFNIDSNINKKIKYLSGGEKQRLAILRAIIKGGDILLFDEPTGNLDKDNSIEILNIIKGLSKNHLCIVVSHDLEMANEYSDIVLTIKDKKIYERKKEIKEEILLDYSMSIIPQLSFLKPYIERNLEQLILENEFGKFEINNDNIFEVINEINKIKTNKKVITKIYKNDKKVPFLQEKQEFFKKNKNKFLSFFSLRTIRNKICKLLASSILSLFLGTFMITNLSVLSFDYGQKVKTILNESNFNTVHLAKSTDSGNITNGYLFNNLTKSISNEIYSYTTIEGISKKNNKVDVNLYIINENQYFEYNNIKYYINDADEVILSSNAKNLFSNNKPLYYIFELEINGEKEIPTINNDPPFAIVSKQYLAKFIYPSIFLSVFPTIFNEKTSSKPIYDNKIGTHYMFSYFNDNSLLYGHAPKAENEVIINQTLAANISENIESVLGKTYNIFDLKNYLNNKTFPCVSSNEQININLFDYFPNGIKITGIIKEDEENHLDVLFLEKIYKKIFCDELINRFDNFIFTSSLTKSTINKLNDFNIEIEELEANPDYFKIKEVNNLAKGNFKVAFQILFVLLFFALFLSIFLYVSHIIKDNYHQIAILKSMGINDKTIFKSFFNVALIPSLISYLISIGLGLLLVSSVNKIVKANTSITISILTVNSVSIFIPLICFILIPLLISLIYLIKIVKIRPYEALKEFK